MDPMTAMMLAQMSQSLLGGIFGGDTTSTQTTSFQLGQLTPEEQNLYNLSMGRIGEAGRRLMTEEGLPLSLRLSALSGDPLAMFGLSSPDIAQMFLEQPGAVTPEQRAAIESAATAGYDIAADRWRTESAAAQRSAQRSTAATLEALSGHLGGGGLLGSSVGRTRMAQALAPIAGGLQDLESRRVTELGSLSRAMQGQIGQMMLEYPLQERAQRLGFISSAILPTALQSRQQQMGLRGQWGANMQALMADPTMAQLLQKMIASGTQTVTSEQEGGWF